jgi:ribonuclease HI
MHSFFNTKNTIDKYFSSDYNDNEDNEDNDGNGNDGNDGNDNEKQIIETIIKKNSTNCINVYTDGSCVHNGKPNAKAGYGIYFGDNDPRNVSKRVNGKQSNNTGELTAVIVTLKILENEIKERLKIKLFTDSEYVIKCCTTYGSKCNAAGWKPISNLELVKEAYMLFRNSPSVQLIHVRAHTGKTDNHSIGNDHADRLANMAIGLTNCPYSNTKNNSRNNNKLYLNVPYGRKEEAKILGCRWDPQKKKWYIMENIDQNKKNIILDQFPLKK